MSPGTSHLLSMRPARQADPRELRDAFGAIPSAVAVLGAGSRESPEREGMGMTVATLLPVSLDPPYLGVMVQTDSTTWPLLSGFESIGVSVLAGHQGWIGRRVAMAARGERFAGVPVQRAEDDTALFIEGAAARFQVRPAGQSAAGDHLFVLLEVQAMAVDRTNEPSIFHRSQFRTLREGDSEPGGWVSQMGSVWQ